MAKVIGFVLLLLVSLGGFAQAAEPVRQSCILGWDAPTTDQGGGALTGLQDYQIFVSQTPGVYGSAAATVTHPTLEVSCLALNLTSGNWFVTVKARDPDLNISIASSELSLTVTTQPPRVHHHQNQ